MKFAKWILVLLLLPLACTRTPQKGEEPVEVTAPGTLRVSSEALSNLKIITAETADFPDALSVTGKISATEDRTFVVPARTAGRIEQVLIASGESVVAGQPLALIFSPDFVAAREEYIQSVRQDQTMAKGGDTENDFSSLASLAKKKLVSMGLSNKDIDALKGAVAARSESEDRTQKFLIVRAPRSGAVIAKSAILGNSVNMGDVLFMIADLHQVWFLGDLYPEDLVKAKKDQEVIIDGTTPEQTLKGRVSFISPIIDATSRTIKIRALMQNPSLSLRGDMYVQGNLILSERQAIMVPAPAILHDPDATYVFKITVPTKLEGQSGAVEAKKLKVSILGERKGMVAISEGLSPGDQVVSEGALLLNAALINSGPNNGK